MNVLTCEKPQPLEVTAPSVNVTIGVLQAAVAVAEPSAAVISVAEGLQPRVTRAGVIIIVGGLGALSHVTVLVIVAELPQPSTAVNILVCEDEQLAVDTAASVNVTVAVLQASVADAEPSSAVISVAAGLQPSGTTTYDPVNVGGIWSEVQLTVLIAVAELPQPSEAMNVLTCENAQPAELTAPSVNVTIGVLQAAVAVAEPRAAVISEAEGLQPRVTRAGVIIMVGGLGALSHVTVLVIVALLPQPSMAVNVLVCEEEQLLVDTAPSVEVMLRVLQPSVAVADPRAAVISVAAGLQPSGTTTYDPVNVGGIWSAVHLTVLVTVAVLPQPSTAVNILVCEEEQLAVDTAPSVNVTVAVLQPSVADAEPSAAVISVAAGLQPKTTGE